MIDQQLKEENVGFKNYRNTLDNEDIDQIKVRERYSTKRSKNSEIK